MVGGRIARLLKKTFSGEVKMENVVQDGKMIDYTNSTGSTIASGDVVVLPGVGIAVAAADILPTETGTVCLEGVHSLTKAAGGGTALAQGARVYWDGTKITATASTNTLAGFVTKAALDADVLVEVKLVAMGDTEPGNLAQAANVAALTEAAGAIGGTNNGDLPDLTASVEALDLNSLSPDAQQDVVSTVVTDGTMTGTADGALETIGSTSGGDVSGAIMNNFKDVQAALALATANDATLGTAITQLVADNVNLRAAIREVAAKLNAEIAALKASALQASS